MTTEELKNHVRELINGKMEDPFKRERAVNIWMKKFELKPKILQLMVEDYPFMFDPFWNDPKTAVTRMIFWEKKFIFETRRKNC